MAPGDYASVGTGKLKLKGVKDSKVDKKKKKKKSKPESEPSSTVQRGGGNHGGSGNDDDDERFQDRSVMLKNLRAEDELIAKDASRGKLVDRGDPDNANQEAHDEQDEAREAVKTDAERRYEEQRRKRVCVFLFLTASFTSLFCTGPDLKIPFLPDSKETMLILKPGF